MLTSSMLLGCLRPGLHWARVRLATTSLGSRAAGRKVFESCRLPVPVPIPVPRRPLPRTTAASLLLAAAGALALSAGAAHADDWGYRPDVRNGTPAEFTADGRLVDVQVQVEGRGTVPLYMAPGRFDRRYFQAFKGCNYSLVVRNNTGRRVGVLIAVDGLNVVNGELSHLGPREPMYVLDPYESTVIRGWRTSLQSVRRFVFVNEERSYAERTGQGNGDLGWIRVLAFREQRGPWDFGPKIREGRIQDDRDWNEEQGEIQPFDGAPQLRGDRKAAPEAAQPYAQREESNPGTGWGEHRFDPVNRTRFMAERSAVDQIVLRYEYARGLRQLGIRIWNGDRLWERERGELGFARPPGW